MERNQKPINNVLNLSEKIVPEMRFTGGDVELWQKNAKSKLKELLGLHLFRTCDDMLEIDFTQEHSAYNEIRFTFQSEEGYFVPCHLLVPKGAKENPPLVICLQGHSTGMHISLGRVKFEHDKDSISGGDRDFALGALKRGYCALAIEQRGMGECGGNGSNGPGCHISTMANLLIGRTTIGERVWDVMRAIDVLTSHFSDKFDVNNIICLGNSGGGTSTLYAACLEERIKTAFVSCAFCGFDESISAMHHCVCNFVPNIRKYFDMGDLGGLVAPRNLIVVSGTEDPIFPLDSAKTNFEITRKLYDEANGNCVHVIGNGGHRFYYDAAWEAYDKKINDF